MVPRGCFCWSLREHQFGPVGAVVIQRWKREYSVRYTTTPSSSLIFPLLSHPSSWPSHSTTVLYCVLAVLQTTPNHPSHSYIPISFPSIPPLFIPFYSPLFIPFYSPLFIPFFSFSFHLLLFLRSSSCLPMSLSISPPFFPVPGSSVNEKEGLYEGWGDEEEVRRRCTKSGAQLEPRASIWVQAPTVLSVGSFVHEFDPALTHPSITYPLSLIPLLFFLHLRLQLHPSSFSIQNFTIAPKPFQNFTIHFSTVQPLFATPKNILTN